MPHPTHTAVSDELLFVIGHAFHCRESKEKKNTKEKPIKQINKLYFDFFFLHRSVSRYNREKDKLNSNSRQLEYKVNLCVRERVSGEEKKEIKMKIHFHKKNKPPGCTYIHRYTFGPKFEYHKNPSITFYCILVVEIYSLIQL